MVLKNVTIFIDNNGNHKAIKSYSFENKTSKNDKERNTVITIGIVNVICQIGVYFCLLKFEQNSLIIGITGFIITCLSLIIFYYGYYKKFKRYKYTNIIYIIFQLILVILIVLRMSQYICYSTIHKIYYLDIKDPLNNINENYFSKGMDKSSTILLRCCCGIIFIIVWILGLKNSYYLYNETTQLVKKRSNIKKLNKMKTEPIQVGTQKANWNQPCIY